MGHSGEKGRLYVLLVEDNPGDADLIQNMLVGVSRPAIELSFCTSLSGALQTLKAHAHDLVLLDLGLPDSAGVPTLERVLSEVPDAAVVVLTGADDLELGGQCIEAGALDCLPKGKAESYLPMALYNAAARARIRKELQESFDNIRNMLDDSRDAMLVLSSTNRVLFANRAAGVLFQNRVQVGEEIGVFIAEPGVHQELDIPQAEGGVRVTELQISATMWHGRPARIVSFRDVTRRKQAEAALKASEERYRLMVESSRDGIFLLQNGRFHFINQGLADLLGYGRQELAAIGLADLCTDEAAAVLEERARMRLDGKTVPDRYELTLKRKDGTEIIAEIRERIIHYEGQESTFAVARDITRQKEILKLLQESTTDKPMEGYIPICSNCYKIRDEKKKGRPWVPPADYLTNHFPKLRFSHGVCPECLKLFCPDFTAE